MTNIYEANQRISPHLFIHPGHCSRATEHREDAFRSDESGLKVSSCLGGDGSNHGTMFIGSRCLHVSPSKWTSFYRLTPPHPRPPTTSTTGNTDRFVQKCIVRGHLERPLLAQALGNDLTDRISSQKPNQSIDLRGGPHTLPPASTSPRTFP